MPPARPTVKPRSLEDRIEQELDAGNDDRDMRRFEKAEKHYRGVIKARPREWRAHYGLGNVFADQQLWENAETSYAKASDLNGKNADIFLALGYVLLQPRARGNDANLLLRAETAARRALALEAENAAANDLLGLALEQRNILSDEAEQAFRKAIAKEPDFAVTYAHLARFLTKKGRLEDADGLYKKAVKLAGEQDAETAILVASELQGDQRWQDSEPLLDYALGKDRDNPAALMLLARAYAVAARYEEAVPLLKRALAKLKPSFMPHYLLGSVYLRLGRAKEAESEFNEAAKFGSEREKCLLSGGFAYGGVGDAYLAAGLPDDAARVYERALACDPNNKELQGKLEQARKKPAK